MSNKTTVLLVVRSVTQAMKGQKLLEQKGISCVLERDTSPHMHNGCGYGLRVSKQYQKPALSILNSVSIEVTRIVEG